MKDLFRLKLPIFISLIALTFLGTGCRAVGDAAADAALTPISVPLGALNQARETEALVEAKSNWDADSVANEMTTAFVLLAGAEAADGAIVGTPFGCDDRIVLVSVPRETDSGNPLQDALTSLFAIRETNWKGYHNALASSALSVEKIQSRDGVTTEIWLKGEMKSAGTCDDPRIKAQIEATVRRLKPKFQIYLNGTEANYRCSGDLSGQCQ